MYNKIKCFKERPSTLKHRKITVCMSTIFYVCLTICLVYRVVLADDNNNNNNNNNNNSNNNNNTVKAVVCNIVKITTVKYSPLKKVYKE